MGKIEFHRGACLCCDVEGVDVVSFPAGAAGYSARHKAVLTYPESPSRPNLEGWRELRASLCARCLARVTEKMEDGLVLRVGDALAEK